MEKLCELTENTEFAATRAIQQRNVPEPVTSQETAAVMMQTQAGSDAAGAGWEQQLIGRVDSDTEPPVDWEMEGRYIEQEIADIEARQILRRSALRQSAMEGSSAVDGSTRQDPQVQRRIETLDSNQAAWVLTEEQWLHRWQPIQERLRREERELIRGRVRTRRASATVEARRAWDALSRREEYLRSVISTHYRMLGRTDILDERQPADERTREHKACFAERERMGEVPPEEEGEDSTGE
jgi:hypothetical protein